MTQTLETPPPSTASTIYKVSPELYDAMMKLTTASAKDVDPTIGELIKIRASQINHCAFCLDMHVADARKQRRDRAAAGALAAWEEAGDLFTEQERAALELTEAITELHHGHVPDEVYAKAAEVFSERELAPGDRDGRHHQRLEPLQRRDPDDGPAPLTHPTPPRATTPVEVECTDFRRNRCMTRHSRGCGGGRYTQ